MCSIAELVMHNTSFPVKWRQKQKHLEYLRAKQFIKSGEIRLREEVKYPIDNPLIYDCKFQIMSNPPKIVPQQHKICLSYMGQKLSSSNTTIFLKQVPHCLTKMKGENKEKEGNTLRGKVVLLHSHSQSRKNTSPAAWLTDVYLPISIIYAFLQLKSRE